MRSPDPMRPAATLGHVLPASLAALGLIALLSACGRTSRETAPSSAPAAQSSVPPAVPQYEPFSIGAPTRDFGRPMVTHVNLVDLDRDGLMDVLYCEAQLGTVRWIRQAPRGIFTERVIADGIKGPAHVSAADLNGSGRPDVLVASMGQIFPNNDRIGSVIVLEHLDQHEFRPRVVLDQVARVSDVRAANFSGHRDGRLDLVVGQFGYAQGEVRWMKNLGDWKFESRIASSLSGCVHTPVADFDGDGRTDFAALLSQEWEEVHLFTAPDRAEARSSVVWGSTNEDYGSSGLEVADVNRDGRPDLIYTNGDGFDYAAVGFRAWHGVQWLENVGGGRFVFRRVGDLPGAYGPCAADLNGDGFVDLIAVSAFAEWNKPNAISLMAWLNDGKQSFTPVVLAQSPTHLITAAVGDLDGNGVPVIVTGGFHAFPPYDRMSNITIWRRK
jgi:hypothetical protein